MTDRVITHEEAREAARRLINSHFRNPDGAQVSIPANPNRDDDLVLMTYIWQRQAAGEAAELRAAGPCGSTMVLRPEADAVLIGGDDYDPVTVTGAVVVAPSEPPVVDLGAMMLARDGV